MKCNKMKTQKSSPFSSIPVYSPFRTMCISHLYSSVGLPTLLSDLFFSQQYFSNTTYQSRHEDLVQHRELLYGHLNYGDCIIYGANLFLIDIRLVLSNFILLHKNNAINIFIHFNAHVNIFYNRKQKISYVKGFDYFKFWEKWSKMPFLKKLFQHTISTVCASPYSHGHLVFQSYTLLLIDKKIPITCFHFLFNY